MIKNSQSERFPLTPMQQGMLYMSLEDTANAGSYVEQVAVTLAAPLDKNRLESAWRSAFAQCPVLTTRLNWKNAAQPTQSLIPGATLPIDYLRWDARDDMDAKLNAFLESDRRAGFQLDACPLTRVTFVETQKGISHFVWTVHHTIVDGRGMALVLQRVFDAYEKDRVPATRPVADFSAYANTFSTLESAGAKKFWQEYLAGFGNRLELPLQKPLLPDETSAARAGIGVVVRDVPVSTGMVRALADATGASDGTIIQAVWGALLHRYTGESTIVYGATKSVRNSVESPGDLIGLYINTLPLRLNVSGNMSVLAWLDHVRQQWLRLRPHENTPLNLIQNWSTLPGGEALFESTLVYERETFDGLIKHARPDLEKHAFKLHECTPGALTIAVYGGAAHHLVAEFDSSRFSSAAISRLLGHFESLLAGMIATPDAKLSQLPLLQDGERTVLLKSWQPAAAEENPPDVLARFDAWVARDPGACAVEQPGNGALSRFELDRMSRALAGVLLARGIQPDDRVGLSIPRSPAMIAGVFGILRAGAAYVPLDPAYPEDRLEHMCSDSGLKEVVTLGEMIDQWRRYVDDPIALDALREAPAAPLPDIFAENLAYVIYTSGSTGVPKGVLVHHGALGAFVSAATSAYGVSETDRFLQFASLSFDAAVEEIFVSLCNGGTLVLRTEEMLTSAEGFFQACADARISVIDLPTAFWHILVDDIDIAALPAGLRLVIIGGEAAQTEKLSRWHAHVPPAVRLLNTYGPTETTVVATCAALHEHTDGSVPPIGRPLPGTRAYVLGADFSLLPVGLPGELLIGGPQVARGYHNRADLNQQRFVTSPFNAGGRLYRTGDQVCYREDGQLVYLGRFDRQVKLRGFRVELDGIEAAIREHAAVKDVAVSVFEPAPGLGQLAAYIVPQDGMENEAGADVLQPWLADRLPAYMQPSAWVSLERLPVAGTGKIDYKALPAPTAGTDRVLTPPASETEERLLGIWRELLGTETFGCEDDFFALGGHSLIAVQLIARVRQEFSKDPALATIFEHATIRELAQYIDALPDAAVQATVRPVRRGAALPLSHDQQELWLFEQLNPGTPTFNIPIAYRLRGALDIDVLERAFSAVVARHESLRTTFASDDGNPYQVIGEPFDLHLNRHQLTESSEPLARQIHQWLCNQAVRPFNLGQGPLMRGDILCLADDDYVLCVLVHHINIDGWSVGIVVKEVCTLYNAFLENAPSSLPPLALQFADFAVWQRTRIDTQSSPSMAYWREKLAAPLPYITWPDDPTNVVRDPRQGAQIPLHIPREVVDALQRCDPGGGTSLFMKLLAVFNLLLYRYTGANEFVVGTISANRDFAELEHLIGFFIHTMTLRTKIDTDDGFESLLAQQKRVLLEAYAHQDLPLTARRAIAQEANNPRPLIQVLFLMQSMDIPPLQLPGVKGEALNVDMGKAIVDLTVEIYETEDGAQGWMEYNTSCFSAETVGRLIRLYQVLLEVVARDTRAPLSNLPTFEGIAQDDAVPIPPVWDVPALPKRIRLTPANDTPQAREIPQDPLELQVSRLWGRILGKPQIYRHDNFFKIGGNSLLAVVMLSQIARSFGQRITPLRLYQSPTLSTFTALVRTENPMTPRTSVHPIRETGMRTPIFFVGSTDLIPPMADSLGPDQPLYSLNIFGLQEDDGGYAFQSVPDIAARFVEDMRTVQPTGPYILGGYCRDTMVAYEMARQLEAEGETVSHLALVDVYWDTALVYPGWYRHLRNTRKLGMAYVFAKWKERMKANREKYNRFKSRFAAKRQDETSLGQSHQDTLFINAYYDAVAASTLAPYGGDVTLYMASEWGLRDVPNWRRLVGGGVTIETIEACHYNIWRQPQIGLLGERIRMHLEQLTAPDSNTK